LFANKCAVVSLGCPKNLVDSEVMVGLLRSAGFQTIANESEAEVLIVNTCGFIDKAKEESIDAILWCARMKDPKYGNCKVLIVTGCLVQRYADELLKNIPEIDGIVGTGNFHEIVSIVQRVLDGEKIRAVEELKYLYDHTVPRVISTLPHTAYVKIAEGCDNRCSYCVIPSIRGRFRSRSIDSIVREVESLVECGVKEVILVAQDTTRYGQDIYGDYSLDRLISKLASIGGLMWIRVLYTYPTRFTDQLIDVIANEPKVCKYVDLPLQHASDEVLKRMNRQGTQYDACMLIEKLRSKVPDITIRSSFIIGFPGETDEQFEELLRFLSEMQLDRVGIFEYSREEGTVAGAMKNQIPAEVKKERFDRAMALQKKISRQKMQGKIGKILDVVIDGKCEENDWVTVGRSQGEAPEIDGLIYIGNQHPSSGEFRKVKIIDAGDYDLVGEIVESE
jgi:ribosomal protein S12 methylthiotransferase